MSMLARKLMDVPASGLSPFSLDFGASFSDAADASSYTFNGVSVPAEASDRIIIVCIGARLVTGSGSISDVTINGVSGSLLGRSTGTQTMSACYTRAVPSGSTVDIGVTLPATGLRALGAVWALYGKSNDTVHSINAFGGGSGTMTTDTAPGGVALGLVYNNSNNLRTDTWANITKRTPFLVDGQAYCYFGEGEGNDDGNASVSLNIWAPSAGILAAWAPP